MDKITKAKKQLENIKENIVGYRFRHFKGNIYVVTDIAINSETEEPMVVYKDVNNPNMVWCRPLNMFLEKVDREKYPDVKQNLRFERIITRDVLHKKYGIERLMPPSTLYEELSSKDAEFYEKQLRITKEMFDHWDDKDYWEDMDDNIE